MANNDRAIAKIHINAVKMRRHKKQGRNKAHGKGWQLKPNTPSLQAFRTISKQLYPYVYLSFILDLQSASHGFETRQDPIPFINQKGRSLLQSFPIEGLLDALFLIFFLLPCLRHRP